MLFLCAYASSATAQPKPLTVVSPPAQRVPVGAPLQVQLVAKGGAAPFTWTLERVQLPEGLKLDAKTGFITGHPAVAGEFRIPVAVTDSSSPAQKSSGELVITVVAALEVRWKQKPQIREGGISGSVVVTNNTGHPLELTIIILAVNEIDKAFALGYQHFNFEPNSESPVIPFGAALPFGTYIVHVDAVAEDLVKKSIYRDRLQTERRLTLQQH